jgi:aminoglycoside phosphotransferase family enzyme/predicted kinase
MGIETLEQHQALAKALAGPEAWPGAARDLRLIQTHISSVLLVDGDAYKLKKPLDLGFLDYSTLDKRRHYCEEELRLNRRLAPDIYLDVVPVCGTPEHPVIGAGGEVIEWAVHMRRFDPTDVLAECPGRLSAELVEQLAADIASFHQGATVAPAEFGSMAHVAGPMRDNIAQIRARRSMERGRLDELSQWLEQRLEACAELIEQRRQQGRIRECHGDLHLNNIVLIDGRPVIFDGIEFSPELRYIDVYADLAFLTMDLARLGRDDLARRLLDRYLQQTGDYTGLPLLRLYEVYRAMVRAKVAAIHAAERNLSADERERIVAELRRYLRVAACLSRPCRRGLVITHGVSGSGKSTVVDELLAALPAVRLRSDVERKRLAGLAADARSGSGVGTDLYSREMTDRTYARLAELAGSVIAAGFTAVVDATFLEADRRRQFADLAGQLAVPFVIIDCDAPETVLRQRVAQRHSAAIDASEAGLAVLARQLQSREPLSAAEQALALAVRPDQPFEPAALEQRLDGAT